MINDIERAASGGRESSEDFDTIADRIVESEIQRARVEIEGKFGRGAKGEDRLAFHNLEHTDGVRERGELLFKSIGPLISDVGERRRVIRNSRLQFANHDREMDSGKKPRLGGGLIRERPYF